MRTGSEIRFWRKVTLCAHVRARIGEHYLACEACCWLWQGGTDAGGYGRSRYVLREREEYYVHRVAWGFAHQGMNPPEDREVAHTCDNPPCCNPSHFWLATHQQNIQDMMDKGRGNRGHRIAKKLGWEKAARIRELEQARLTQREIAAVMGCSQVMVCHVLKGRAWPDKIPSPMP